MSCLLVELLSYRHPIFFLSHLVVDP